MMPPLLRMINALEAMTITKKTTLLFLIMVVGMLFIGSFAHMSINRIKNNFDILYTKQMLPTIRLEHLKDIYTVNILDTIRDIEKEVIRADEGKVVIALAQELIVTELEAYKRSLMIDESDWLVKLARSWGMLPLGKHPLPLPKEEERLLAKIESKVLMIDEILHKMFTYFESAQTFEAYETLQEELYPSVYSINSDITTLITLNFDHAKEGFAKTEVVYTNTFEWIVLGTLGTIVVAALLAVVILQNIRLLHVRLATRVEDKTQELQELNKSLEERIAKEVELSRQKDEIMFRQARLASMGEMIGNIAHQWRQPLNAMVLIIQSFQMKRMAGLELSDAFIEEQAKEGIALGSMMSQTIEDFRNFFRPNRQEELFGLLGCVNHTIQLIKDYYEKAGITLYVNARSEMWVKGYPNEFSQVMMNLLSNAKDALEEHGKSPKIIEVEITSEDNQAVVRVIDNGGGIDEKVMDRMFEPYFTTKHKSSGTGIGLYMSQQIIEKQMQGALHASNAAHRFRDGEMYERCAVISVRLAMHNKEE